MTTGKSGPSTVICGECTGLLEYDYLAEYWVHVETGKEECIDTGQNDEQDDVAEAELARYLDHK